MEIEMNYKTIPAGILVLTLFFTFNCKKTYNSDTTSDAISSATIYSIVKYELPDPGTTYTVVGTIPGINKYVIKYSDRFYRGGDILNEEGARKLSEFGIKTIVSVTPSDLERDLASQYSMELIEMPFDYQAGVQDTDQSRFADVIFNSDEKVYVHCHGGTKRAGALMVLYRQLKDNWTFEEAVDEYSRLGGNEQYDHQLLESVNLL
jgi:protein tyrosine phosphatase (PTP) superfamily phosphohydrolase (DUF442 family)